MKIFTHLFIVLLAFATSMAKNADSLWKKEAVGGFNLTNAYYDNWAAGGENAVSWNLKLNGKIERDDDKTNWKNSGKAEFGNTKISDTPFRKSMDEMFFETVLSYKLTDLFNPYLAATAQS